MELSLAANTTFVDMRAVSARGFLRPVAERTKARALLHVALGLSAGALAGSRACRAATSRRCCSRAGCSSSRGC